MRKVMYFPISREMFKDVSDQYYAGAVDSFVQAIIDRALAEARRAGAVRVVLLDADTLDNPDEDRITRGAARPFALNVPAT